MSFLDLIGETAGSIWQGLETKGPLSLSALKKQVKAPPDLVLMAVGWLAREEKLALDLWYVENASFGLDLKIFVMTFAMVLFGERVDQMQLRRASESYRSRRS